MSLSLYKIANEYQRAFDELSAMDDITDEIIKDSLANIETAFQDKVVNIGAYIKNLEAQETAMYNYIIAMRERQLSFQIKIGRLKDYLMQNLQAMGLNKIVSAELDVGLRNSPGSVVIDDESKIPAKFIREKVERYISRKEIADAIKAGEEVEGARLEKSQYLIIK